jgi:hypothetical protein
MRRCYWCDLPEAQYVGKKTFYLNRDTDYLDRVLVFRLDSECRYQLPVHLLNLDLSFLESSCHNFQRPLESGDFLALELENQRW